MLPARITKAFSSDARVSVLDVQSVPDLDEARVLLELQLCSRPPCAVSADGLATQLQLRSDQLDTEMLHVKWIELTSGAQGSDPTQAADPTPTTAFWLLVAFASAGTTLLVVRRSVSRTGPSRGYGPRPQKAGFSPRRRRRRNHVARPVVCAARSCSAGGQRQRRAPVELVVAAGSGWPSTQRWHAVK